MNILILGSGGREHALAWKIAASPLADRLYCAPGNAGIAREAECVALDIADHAAVIAFCREASIDLWSLGRRHRSAPASSTISKLPASKRLGRAAPQHGSKAPRDLPRISAAPTLFRPPPMSASVPRHRLKLMCKRAARRL